MKKSHVVGTIVLASVLGACSGTSAAPSHTDAATPHLSSTPIASSPVAPSTAMSTTPMSTPTMTMAYWSAHWGLPESNNLLAELERLSGYTASQTVSSVDLANLDTFANTALGNPMPPAPLASVDEWEAVNVHSLAATAAYQSGNFAQFYTDVETALSTLQSLSTGAFNGYIN